MYLIIDLKLKNSYALFPKTNPNAPSKIDFPAPVSPVITENRFEKSVSRDSINA